MAINIFWFRRDLRIHDNHGLYNALRGKNNVLPIFIFDTEILEKLAKDDARVTFIHETLQELKSALQAHKGTLAVYHGKPFEIFNKLAETHAIEHVITNHDYEPYAQKRDAEIKQFLAEKNIGFHTYKDQVIFEKDEIVKNDGTPYVVYTPYSKRWLAKLDETGVPSYSSEDLLANLAPLSPIPFPALKDIGFERSNIDVPKYTVDASLIKAYEATRNFPALDSTSKLGAHLRFGTVSIREMVKKAQKEVNNTFLKELIWREFFMHILWHFPHTGERSFKPKYDRIQWRNKEEEFKKWCEGQTGYPLVDAGMRELNQTGFMHNRVRMVVGSFLCKHLLIDWRLGEAYFAEKLLDYDMASNVGNWQWVAGCGVDAAPYFRIFNPTSQIKKFDNEMAYIKKWVPEFQELSYPTPIVDHAMARERCLKVYKEALT